MNGNEYCIDDRRYVKQIQSCVVIRRCGETYEVSCRIIQRGNKIYQYNKGSDFLGKSIGDKKLWLGELAKMTMKGTTDEFDRFAAIRDKYTRIPLQRYNGDIYLKLVEANKYDFIFEYIDDDNNLSCCVHREVGLEAIARHISDHAWEYIKFGCYTDYKEEKDYLFEAIRRNT